MPKDTKKNRYLTVGIAWDSWTLQQLEADGKLHQMDDQLAKLMVLRLTEYYKLVERGAIVPGVTAMMQQHMPIQAAPGSNGNGHAILAQAPQSSNGSSSSRQGSGSAAAPADPQTVGESELAGENADAALDSGYWDMDEDE